MRSRGERAGLPAFFGLALVLAVVAFAEEDPADPLDGLRALLKQGKYAEAEQGGRALLAEVQATGGTSSARGARVLDVIVEARWRAGLTDDPETLALARRAVATKEAALGTGHAEVAESLNNLAVVHFFAGDYAEARPLWERALAIRRDKLPPDHPDLAQSLNSLANLLQTVGDYGGARPLYEQAMAIRIKAFGPEHPLVAQTLNNLGAMLATTGDYTGARPLLERALEIKEKTLGADHPKVAESLNALAELLWAMGERDRSRAMFQRAQKVWEDALGPENPSVAASLNNLAELLSGARDYPGARPLYERALAIWEKAYGPEHPQVALANNNLGVVLTQTGDSAAAKRRFETAVKIDEKTLGPEHPALAEALDNLGLLLTRTGELTAARPPLERALTVRRTTLGADHPLVADSLRNLAELSAAAGDSARALDLALDSERIGRDHLRLTGRALSEQGAMHYAAVRSAGLDLALTLAERGLDPAATRRTLDAVIRSRAVVLDEMAARHHAVIGSSDPRIARLADALASTRSRLANLTVRGLGNDEPARYKKLLDEARASKESAETALAAASASFALEQERVRTGLDQVASGLPPRSALVAFVLNQDPGKKSGPRYVALVLPADREKAVAIGLGPAGAIDAAVAAWKKEAAGGAQGRDAEAAEAAYRVAGGALRRLIWDPLVPALGNVERAFIVPDGALNLVSFAAFPVDDSGYLVERGPTLHYASAERDLARGGTAERRGTGLLALGGPDYDMTRVTPPAAAGSTRGLRSGCGSFDDLVFEPLPAAAREAGEVASRWDAAIAGGQGDLGAVVHLDGAAAGEKAFRKSAMGRRVLHLATHGFFLGGDCGDAAAGSRGLGLVTVAAKPATSVAGISPLLLSGLALAGANRRVASTSGDDDGILTAEEIAGLDLSGVEWAVLSACDTGIGEVKAGEGVFGMRRAIQVAGVRTLVSSLWAVDDAATRQWMNALYDARLTRRLDTAESVRSAARTVLESGRKSGRGGHPFYWAAFVAAGEWR